MKLFLNTLFWIMVINVLYMLFGELSPEQLKNSWNLFVVTLFIFVPSLYFYHRKKSKNERAQETKPAVAHPPNPNPPNRKGSSNRPMSRRRAAGEPKLASSAQTDELATDVLWKERNSTILELHIARLCVIAYWGDDKLSKAEIDYLKNKIDDFLPSYIEYDRDIEVQKHLVETLEFIEKECNKIKAAQSEPNLEISEVMKGLVEKIVEEIDATNLSKRENKRGLRTLRSQIQDVAQLDGSTKKVELLLNVADGLVNR